ncbi:uncharacterized protein LOC131248746 isoform X2 [Magnolia sinica]|uniref:uncharacterized protein LOC131248746 isoform X2 n=1 Tax=Magnolia sinica TaxID=86752 RepID=UPI002657B3C4|nr:uncharacterized protein LOC131248746 isoform X2 [Magnolia sinica]
MFSSQILSSTLKPFSSHSNPSFPSHHRSNALPIPLSLRFEPLESQPKIEESPRFPFEPSESRPKIEGSSEFPADPSESHPLIEDSSSGNEDYRVDKKSIDHGGIDANGDKEEKRISGIHVPRQRYISVSKAELLDGILSMFESQESIDDFLQVSLCLDSIIHAEHKSILEEMRIDYSLTQSPESKGNSAPSLAASEEDLMDSLQPLASDDSLGSESVGNSPEKDKNVKPPPFYYGLDLSFLLRLSVRRSRRNSVAESRIAVATRFQRAFMKLLHNAEFEELSAADLLLTSALNTDYLLTLPIYVDWKKASDSKAIIFRRGYATERQKGFLIGEKLDYLQSRLLQGIFFTISRPLEKVGLWINEAMKSASQTEEIQNWIERFRTWLKELSLPQGTHSYDEMALNEQLVVDQLSDSDLPIWFAAQRAVPRYEGLLSSVLGPRGRLLRKLLMWIGIIPSMPETSFKIDNASKSSEPYLRPNSLSRISLADIWKPATRESCGNDLWKMFKTSISVLFSQSVLQEPAFEELILLYTEEQGQRETEDEAEIPSLQLKIYERIPIPDLLVRLDVASILGLLAFFVNYKFENILSSPSAILLDVIAISALIIYVTRVALGYKQTWDRYQLLVNKTLYEKTLASGFGSVHFLLDASEQQQYKESILAYALLLQADEREAASRKSIGDTCERFMYDKFNEKVEMPIDKAMDTLLRLGLVAEISPEGSFRLQALPCSKAYETLKKRWDSLLG